MDPLKKLTEQELQIVLIYELREARKLLTYILWALALIIGVLIAGF